MLTMLFGKNKGRELCELPDTGDLDPDQRSFMINRKPVVGLKAIHERFFVAEDGFEIISYGTLRRLSREMQASGAICRFIVRKNGKKSVRIMTLEPFFSLWMLKKFGTRG